MSLALFDILTGRLRDGRSIRDLSPGEGTLLSIRGNLEGILNARRQPLPHLAMGLPDLGEIYQGLPYSFARLVAAVQETVAAGEPRLSHVSVRPCPEGVAGPRLSLEIAGSAGGEVLRFRALFQGGRAVEVAVISGGDYHA